MQRSRMKTLTAAVVICCALVTTAHAAMTVSNAKTRNVNCTGGVCTPTGGNANLNVGELVSMLATTDMTIKSSAAAPDIAIVDPLTWASSHRLTLDAFESIHVRAPIVVEGTAGITLTTNDGGSGGDYNFNTATSGAITFWDTTSILIINGTSYTLEKDIKSLAVAIADNPSNNFALANNYDASVDGSYDRSPVGAQFGGTFEGLGNTIQNLTIAAGANVVSVGLFYFVVNGAIRDINLSNANVSGSDKKCTCDRRVVGALVGSIRGPITSVNVTGSVLAGNGPAYVGGLTGNGLGNISNSSFSGTVSGLNTQDRVGGLAGYSAGFIQQSVAIVKVTSGAAGGGLAGSAEAITLSRAYGTVSGVTAGGLVGYGSSGMITQSFASVDVTFRNTGGGLIGISQANQIVQSYSTGSVESKGSQSQSVGGFAGWGVPIEVSEAYAVGRVKGKDTEAAGGFMGRCDNSTVSSSYWDVTTTRRHHDRCDATGLTDAQMKSGLPAGFDPNVWGQNPNINNGWPYLLANPPQ